MRQTKNITVALAAACAALAGATAATPAQATILATEDFSGVTLSPSTSIALNGVSDGTGWKSGATWVTNGTKIPGYNVSNVTPMTGADNSNYATGGYNYGIAYRYLDTTATGTFGSAGLVNPTTHHIGVAGTTILMSVLLGVNSNLLYNSGLVALGNNNNTSGSYANAAVSNCTGYQSLTKSNTISPDWIVNTSDGGPSPNNVDYTQSSQAVVAGTPTELVMEIQYTTGTAANLSMWVNPVGYNDLNPAIPTAPADATLASTDATFSTVVLDSSGPNGHSAEFTDLVIATPSSVPEPAALAMMAVGGLGLLIRRKRKTA